MDTTTMLNVPAIFIGAVIFVIILFVISKFRDNNKKPKTFSDVEIIEERPFNETQSQYLKEYSEHPHKERIHGLPGGNLDIIFDKTGEIGADAEHRTATILNSLTNTYPDLHVFHSIHYEDKKWDIDHILIHGNQIIVIDSKRWENGKKYTPVKHSTFGKVQVLRNGQPFAGGLVSSFSARKIQKDYPRYQTTNIVCIESAGGYINPQWLQGIDFLRKDQLENKIHKILEKTTKTKNNKIVENMKKFTRNIQNF